MHREQVESQVLTPRETRDVPVTHRISRRDDARRIPGVRTWRVKITTKFAIEITYTEPMSHKLTLVASILLTEKIYKEDDTCHIREGSSIAITKRRKAYRL